MSIYWANDNRPGEVAAMAIGGIADGQVIRGQAYGFRYHAHEPETHVTSVGAEASVSILMGRSCFYSLRTLQMRYDQGPVRAWSVFVCPDEKMNDFDIMDRLMQGYRPVVGRYPLPR